VADEDRSAAVVEGVLGERERLLDAQAGAPEDRTRQPWPSSDVWHRHDLIDHRGSAG
jgi:hypothetical protein